MAMSVHVYDACMVMSVNVYIYYSDRVICMVMSVHVYDACMAMSVHIWMSVYVYV